MNYNYEHISFKVEKSIDLFLKNDLLLLRDDAHELSVSHKLAEYLHKELPEWHIDCDYNRRENQIKELNGERIRPDIIIHLRNLKRNLLVIEIKKSNNLDDVDDDRRRLCLFTSPGEYEYRFGLLIIFYVVNDCNKYPELEWYIDGQRI